MGHKYNQLSATERNDLHSRILKGESLRSIARGLGRSASTLSREISRNSEEGEEYDACLAGYARRSRRRHGLVKLREGSALRGLRIRPYPAWLVTSADLRQAPPRA